MKEIPMWAWRFLSVGGCLLILSGLAPGQPDEKEQVLRDRVLHADSIAKAGKAYQEYFQYFGITGLQKRLTDTHTGIALQAAWEIHKKPTKRTKPIPGRTDHVYDEVELAKFLAFVKERTKTPVPPWWAEAIVKAELFPNQHHAFSLRINKAVPKFRKSQAAALVPDGAELEPDGDSFVYRFGGRSVKFKKKGIGTTIDSGWHDCVVGLVGEKRSVIAVYDGGGGFPFNTAGFEGTGEKAVWLANVWATGRDAMSGIGTHWVELNETKGVVYVFGAESHGMYLEAFDNATGKCAFRFCTSYWENFSETWGLK
jgi:hypothetical protein